jgi:SAM-dependent methyltransferase
MMTDPDEYTRRLAAESGGDPTAWFDRLYAAAHEGSAVVPWDIAEPHFLVAEWARSRPLDGQNKRALVVGCGLGRDAEFIAAFGFATTAFDVAPTAVDDARRRHAGSPVRYVRADLLDPPPEWRHEFDLVLESLTVQSLPASHRGPAIARVPQFVAPGGTLLVVAAGRDDAVAPGNGPPWPLARAEIDTFATDGVEPVRIEAIHDPAAVAGLRWRAEFRRP